jgi:hypothetical protein
MKLILAAAAAFMAVLIGSGAAAEDTRTLSQFILVCNSSPRTCIANLEDYLRASRDQGFVCLPEGLSLHEAAYQELSWLQKEGGADDKLNQGTAEDAQWLAINKLWPCKKDETPAAP